MLSLIPTALQIIGLLTGSSPLGKAIETGSSLLKLLASDKAEDVAGKVIDSAKSIFGTSDPKEIELQIQRDKGLTERYMADVSAATERERLWLDDVQSARARDLEVRKTSPAGTNPRANVMLIGAFVCAITILLLMASYGSAMKEMIATALTMALGTILKMLSDAFQFEFGSSRSSAEKTDTINTILGKR